jgi:hypothetical protein
MNTNSETTATEEVHGNKILIKLIDLKIKVLDVDGTKIE